MLSFAYNYGTYYQVVITDGTDENSFAYEFTTRQNIETSIAEALLLAKLEVSRKLFIPTAI